MADEKESLFRKLFEPIIRPLNGLIHFLEILKENNIPRAIASSAPPENVHFTLEKTGVKKYFNIMLDESSFNKGKPDPEIYLTGASLIRSPPDRCIVFKDSLAGAEASRAAGCKVIAVTTTYPGPEFVSTDLVIDDFENLELSTLADLFQINNQN